VHPYHEKKIPPIPHDFDQALDSIQLVAPASPVDNVADSRVLIIRGGKIRNQ
jgi:hypothetical protein